MKGFELSFGIARSKVARRVVLLFVTCALIPIAVLAAITEWRVTGELSVGAWTRLKERSKTTGMEILERLNHLETELSAVTASDGHASDGEEGGASLVLRRHKNDGFASVSAVTGEPLVALQSVFGSNASATFPPQMPSLLAQGRSVLLLVQSGQTSRVVIMRSLSTASGQAYLVGEADRNYLLGLGEDGARLTGVEGCVIADSIILDCTSPALREVGTGDLQSVVAAPAGRAELRAGGNELLAAAWTLPLHAWSLSRGWTIVSTQPKADAFRPLTEFRWSFVLSVLMSVWIVLLASFVQIRRSLQPLEQLREATVRVAARDLSTPVVVSSKDEFEDLAKSFNTMTRELDRERIVKEAIADLDRSVLSALEATAIVRSLLERLPPLLNCASVAVTLVDDVKTGKSRTHARSLAKGNTTASAVVLASTDIERLHARDTWCIDVANEVPAFLKPMLGAGVRYLAALPVHSNEVLAAVVTLGYSSSSHPSVDALNEARRLLGPISVALSNARLHEALEKLNLGTLNALARTVDAKCRWTAGHSERVAAIAVQLAKALGLRRDEVELVYRGALLHDIGKIGVPNEIIDKAGKLTAEEWVLVKAHPGLGARILEPIAEYQTIIPMVLQHHEWIDGSGYPGGLSGKDIHPDAKLLSVADVYDAIRSDRPYRAGMSLAAALDLIRTQAGRQFDPRMTGAFLDLVASKPGMFEVHSAWDGYQLGS